MDLKKALSLLCAAALLLGLSACGKTEGDGYSKKASVSVVSDLYGEGFTNGGTCIPRESGNDVTYDQNTFAVMTVTLTGGGAPDPNKLDTSKAYVRLDEGDGYYPYDLQFNGTALGAFENGTYTYRLRDGDLKWVNDPSYEVRLGGLEWSAQGGDGNGLYTFNLSVRGITYDGAELAPGYFRARVYIYGREFSKNDATWGVATITNLKFSEPVKAPLTQKPAVDKEPVWTWVGADEHGKPLLCDFPRDGYDAIDNFYISWPSGVDASELTADDITVILTTAYTEYYPEDACVLVPNTQMVTLPNGERMPDGDYSVFSEAGETQICVNKIHWAFAPVYTKMTIRVDTSKVTGYDKAVETTYDIASVYAYRYQTGGGSNTDGTVTCQPVFGVANIGEIKLGNIASMSAAHKYTYNSQSGKSYLIENADETFAVTASEDAATVYEDTDPQLLGHTIYSTQYQQSAEVDGKTVTFRMAPTSTIQKVNLERTALNAIDGYALPTDAVAWSDHLNWA